MTDKVDMSQDDYCNPCCGPWDNKYPCGFFLTPKMIEKLGLDANIKPEQVMSAEVTLKLTSVTLREGQVEAYAVITEMGIMKTDRKNPASMLADSYGDSDGDE